MDHFHRDFYTRPGRRLKALEQSGGWAVRLRVGVGARDYGILMFMYLFIWGQCEDEHPLYIKSILLITFCKVGGI